MDNSSSILSIVQPVRSLPEESITLAKFCSTASASNAALSSTGLAPTPAQFPLAVFEWNHTEMAADYFGMDHQSDKYVSSALHSVTSVIRADAAKRLLLRRACAIVRPADPLPFSVPAVICLCSCCFQIGGGDAPFQFLYWTEVKRTHHDVRFTRWSGERMSENTQAQHKSGSAACRQLHPRHAHFAAREIERIFTSFSVCVWLLALSGRGMT